MKQVQYLSVSSTDRYVYCIAFARSRNVQPELVFSLKRVIVVGDVIVINTDRCLCYRRRKSMWGLKKRKVGWNNRIRDRGKRI